jgi:hypothetical protein
MRKGIGRSRFVLGFVIGSLVFGSTAFALTVNNTAQGGYLFCANTRTKSVIFPGTLSCPNGYKQLALGAQGSAGNDGTDGVNGTDGINATPKPTTEYIYRVAARDLVYDGTATTLIQGKRIILARIGKTNLGDPGTYQIRANLEAQWSSSARIGSLLQCFFQNSSDYPDVMTTTSGYRYFGTASTQYQNWNTIDLTVWGGPSDYSLGKGDVYLVCIATGSITGLSGSLTATRTDSSQGMNLGPAS